MAEGDDGPSMKELTSTSFGYLIAFLLPGMLGLYALSYWFPPTGALLQPILKADATVGPSVVFLLIAAGMGLCLSAARFFVLEKGVYKGTCLSDELHKGLAPDKLALLNAYADQHYRYHQFYGGCFLAVLILCVGWWRGQWPFDDHPFSWHTALIIAGFGVFELLLERSSHDAFTKYVKKCNALVPEQANIKNNVPEQSNTGKVVAGRKLK